MVISSNGKVNQFIQTLRFISGCVLVFKLFIKGCDESATILNCLENSDIDCLGVRTVIFGLLLPHGGNGHTPVGSPSKRSESLISRRGEHKCKHDTTSNASLFRVLII